MTTNITLGNTAQFVAEFQTIPTGAILTIVYPTGVTTASTSLVMVQDNSFFTVTWQSSVSSLGIANWSITASGDGSPSATGNLRIITP